MNGTFPESCKIATIIPISKPGKDNSNPANYRPIAMDTILSGFDFAFAYLDDILKSQSLGEHKCNIIAEGFRFIYLAFRFS